MPCHQELCSSEVPGAIPSHGQDRRQRRQQISRLRRYSVHYPWCSQVELREGTFIHCLKPFQTPECHVGVQKRAKQKVCHEKFDLCRLNRAADNSFPFLSPFWPCRYLLERMALRFKSTTLLWNLPLSKPILKLNWRRM